MEPPEFLKSNDHHLKFCILYEVALKKPIFESYRTFCDAVGKDAIRILNSDPVPKALMDMPVNLMRKITENLNPYEQCYFRSMNHDMKNFTDSFPTVFESLCVEANDSLIRWKLNENDFECTEVDDGCTFTKPKCLNTDTSDETTAQRYNNRVTRKYEECYVKKSLEYLTPLFKVPKLRTHFLRFAVKIRTPEFDELLPVSFYAERAYFVAYDFDKMVQDLSIIKAGHLASFTIEFEEPMGRERFTKVFETDQFKQAQSVEIHCILEFNLEDLVNFRHLKQFICGVRSLVDPEEILQIRDTVSTFENLEACVIMYQSNGNLIRPFVELLEEDVPEGPLERIKNEKESSISKSERFK
ncbi:unnamed protein product [Caenorhabditis nigoni]